MWLSSLLLKSHDLIRKAQPHHERSPFSPLSFPIHDPRLNFHTPTSLSGIETQTARCVSLLLRRHLCKHFLLPQLHVPKHHFSDTHTHMLINTYETRFLCHSLKFKSARTTSLPQVGFKYFSPDSCLGNTSAAALQNCCCETLVIFLSISHQLEASMKSVLMFR